MPRDRSRGSDGTGDNERRLEPSFIRAVEDNNVSLLDDLLDTARRNGQSTENLLKIGLMKGAEKGKLNATIFLLKHGARPDGYGNRVGPLMRAVERNHISIVKVLLENRIHPVNRNESDKKGRSVLMTAAWKNHYHILQLLLSSGADINARDGRGRNVLHNLAADTKCDWGQEVVDLLLKSDVRLADSQDELLRTPLHWCCATGKRMLAEKLLTRHLVPRVDINAMERGQKTPLHLAVIHGRDDIVELLLEHGADIHANSTGGWTALHNACAHGSNSIVKMLIQSGADINARLFNGRTPLHAAAEAGHVEVVKTLLSEPNIRRVARDSFGFTSFLLAAQQKHRECVSLLAPCNHSDSLSHDALGACQGFFATVTDFGNYKNGNQVKRISIYELLYGRSPDNPHKAAFEALPTNTKPTNFRWIHLPANNIAWIEALMSKCFVEEGHHDVDGFKAIEKSFTNQHRGLKVHSHFMRPMCQLTPRASNAKEDDTSAAEEATPVAKLERAATGLTAVSSDATTITSAVGSIKENGPFARENGDSSKSKRPRKANTRPNLSKKNTSKDGQSTPKLGQIKKTWSATDTTTTTRPKSPFDFRAIDAQPRSNLFCFAPFLHFETSSARRQMQQAICQARQKVGANTYGKGLSCDEMLIRAHVTGSSTSLHIRRTLDQFFYHNIDTDWRDEDQVVYRYQYTNQASTHNCDPKIFMVDQLWMWLLGKDLVVTCFPQRWNQPRNDPLNVLDGIIEDVNSKTRDPIKSVYDLALTITARCTGVFDRHRIGDGDYQFLDMFESSIGNATDRETSLFMEFNKASRAASEWLMTHRKPNRFSKSLEHTTRMNEHEQKRHNRHHHSDAHDAKFHFDDEDSRTDPMFVDQLLDIGQETDLLAESKDIRDEINMINKVLEDQRQILDDLGKSICEIYLDEQRNQYEVRRRIKEQIRSIDLVVKDLDRMDKQAARIYDSITNLLDLKQKHANAFEARFARDQAAGTARQSQTIMVFTIVTIIFLPLSFIAGFFTINIRELPRDPTNDWGLPMGYVMKYIFGIGFAISIPLIAIALSLDDLGDAWREAVRRWRERKHVHKVEATNHQISAEDKYRRSVEVNSIKSAFSNARSYRRPSVWAGGGHLLPVTSRTTAPSHRS
ncbi:ankyrin repeat-containing protein 29 [Elsinoe australis]|uniref:Ankyrin repeat-containing protein 29 n=1 Tax=Elsinoe australis TaxID=40998 RepID=A0A4U7AR65_9PEZI|nr:ankyrin repeat-containing protein 29 [Elsinoe australis]